MKKFLTELVSVDRLPPALQNAFWESFANAVEEEILRMIALFEEKKIMYDTNLMTEDQLREISVLLGVVFNATVDDSIEFLRKEVQAIPFKIMYKATIVLYQSFIKALSRIGQVYVYLYKSSSEAIIRSAEDILLQINAHDPLKPWIHYSAENFTGILEDALKLDDGLILDIEDSEGDTWTLDTVDSEITTNHLAIEFYVDRLITKSVLNEDTGLFEDKEYCITWEYMDFVQVNLDFSRRAIEVPHVGCHLNFITDNSGNVNPLDIEYTHPDIKLKACVDPVVFAGLASVYDLSYMEFGVGVQENLPVKEGGGAFPLKLDKRVARSYIFFDEKFENNEWLGVVGEYKGQQINNFSLHDSTGYLLEDVYGDGACDGVNTEFRGTLLFAPLQKGNIVFKYESGNIKYLIQDDGRGVLSSDSVKGVVDYDTGRYSFTTNIIHTERSVMGIGDGIETVFSYNITVTEPLVANPADPAIKIIYTINNRRYIGNDDGLGNITGAYINIGSVDYVNSIIDLTFSDPPTEDSEIVVEYKFPRNYVPDNNSEIKVDYYFTYQTIEITEVGIYNTSDELVGYSTFPPLEFSNPRNHANLGFIIHKTPLV